MMSGLKDDIGHMLLGKLDPYQVLDRYVYSDEVTPALNKIGMHTLIKVREHPKALVKYHYGLLFKSGYKEFVRKNITIGYTKELYYVDDFLKEEAYYGDYCQFVMDVRDVELAILNKAKEGKTGRLLSPFKNYIDKHQKFVDSIRG